MPTPPTAPVGAKPPSGFICPMIGWSNTQVTSAGVKKLAGLKHLKLLNLHGTSVDDAAIATLGGMTSLESLYLWNTKVTPDAAKKLREKLPNTRINIGWEHEPPVKVVEPPPPPEPKKEQAAAKPAEAKK